MKAAGTPSPPTSSRHVAPIQGGTSTRAAHDAAADNAAAVHLAQHEELVMLLAACKGQVSARTRTEREAVTRRSARRPCAAGVCA